MKSDNMFNRILKLPTDQNSSLFLFGPRGTGKTSWIKSNLPDCLYLDLLEFSTYNSLSANPGRLENLIPNGYDKIVVLDEVQRVPELLNEVHRLIESKNIRFLLTGSSARSLRRKGVNLLAGRALTYHMHPLVIQELNGAFDLNQILTYGLLPATFGHPDPKKYLESYVQTYLREEVIQEGLTRNIGAFSRFLEAASFSQGSILNFSEIARELAINRLVIVDYFEILEDLLSGNKNRPFYKSSQKKNGCSPKVLFL